MTNRDQYFYDICWEAGLNPSEPSDWINIGHLFSDPCLKEAEEIRDLTKLG